ncbi:uncharacterized protein I303_103607 [Kwoniella dejecticola CBS 10117]|uniref:Uncharacterized protein n=1 Tax=Kwoniella dejecticola CBS 10117 TaxID=1296121 RepID=A0A1A6A781_9TREE|nr:uncharacterized protein I303_03629 [Kwoniella dejecticola CBS 10117]OBR85914.1 hypothetical protein I303_03629 [Kwoniella dejecticola CBS 10117]
MIGPSIASYPDTPPSHIADRFQELSARSRILEDIPLRIGLDETVTSRSDLSFREAVSSKIDRLENELLEIREECLRRSADIMGEISKDDFKDCLAESTWANRYLLTLLNTTIEDTASSQERIDCLGRAVSRLVDSSESGRDVRRYHSRIIEPFLRRRCESYDELESEVCKLEDWLSDWN